MNKRSSLSLFRVVWYDVQPWLCFVTAMALAVVVFTDWFIPFPENWPR